MKIVQFRVITTVVAVAVATVIVVVLTHSGNSMKGPIENAVTYSGDVVQKIEKKLIVEERTDKRSDKLAWLQPYLQNKAMFSHPDRILLGAFDNETHDSYESIISLEDSLKTTFPLMQLYVGWTSKPEGRFPASQIKNIYDLGSVPVITWEPWLSDFNEEEFPGLRPAAERDKNGMKDVASGQYDKYIKKWALAAKELDKPLFLRFGHEMNDGYRYPWGPQNNAPEDFIAAWRHVHLLFARMGVKNVIWIWGPHPAYEFKSFYPGDAYVDYVGVGTLNYGTIAVWSQWWTFKDIFGKYYGTLSAYKKPIMITEFGSLGVGGNRSRWYSEALDSMPQRYPLIKSILFFHFSKDNTTTQQTLNWYFKNDKLVTNAIVRAMAKWPVPDSIKQAANSVK